MPVPTVRGRCSWLLDFNSLPDSLETVLSLFGGEGLLWGPNYCSAGLRLDGQVGLVSPGIE